LNHAKAIETGMPQASQELYLQDWILRLAATGQHSAKGNGSVKVFDL